MAKRTVTKTPPEADARVERSRKAVIAATFQLLTETGFGGFSVDAVSKRSGVAKTTIYRHWPSRAALLMSVCSTMGTRPEPPGTGSLQGDLEVLLTRMASNLRSARWAAILPSLMDSGERDPELAEVQANIHAGFMGALRTVVEQAQERGELPPGPAADVIAVLAGPLFYRRFVSREPLDERFIRSVIHRVAPGPAAEKNPK